jgi:hypothetical protein
LRVQLLDGGQGFACDCRRVVGDRKRLQTSRRLEPVFGVALRLSRIDTLKCRFSTWQRVFGRRASWPSKHMRGGRKPNGWVGKPRRGKRSREHRLLRSPNRVRSSTDSQSEQRSEVVVRGRFAGRNDMRATGIERCRGWLGGKSSGGRNPVGGCGAKQSHEARAGSNR